MSTTTTPASSGIELTRKGERYVAEHANASYFARLRKIRRKAVREIERLMELVDRIDGDPNLEDDGSAEPTLGWPSNGYGARALRGPQEDGELEHSLGWTKSGALGASDYHGGDLEDDPCDVASRRKVYEGRACRPLPADVVARQNQMAHPPAAKAQSEGSALRC